MSACRDIDAHTSVESRYLDRSAERGCWEVDEQVIDEVIVVAEQFLVWNLLDGDDKVARLSALNLRRIALARKLELLSVEHASRDGERDFLALDLALLGHARCNLLKSELDSRAAVSPLGLATSATESGTEYAFRAIGSTHERITAIERICAAAASATAAESACCTSKELVEDVEWVESSAIEASCSTAKATCTAHTGMTELVVTRTLVVIAQYVVCLGYLLEVGFGSLLFGIRSLTPLVRVPFESQLAVGFLDFVGTCSLLQAKHLIIVTFCCHKINDYWPTTTLANRITLSLSL